MNNNLPMTLKLLLLLIFFRWIFRVDSIYSNNHSSQSPTPSLIKVKGTPTRLPPIPTEYLDSSGSATVTRRPTSIPPGRATNTPTPTRTLTPTRTPTPTLSCSKKSEGDADCDGKINSLDFDIWKNEFLKNETNTSAADFNNDGKTDLIDFEIWRKNWSKINLSSCQWCGQQCTKEGSNMDCPDVMPPENKVCEYDLQTESCVIRDSYLE